jgi:hypothetical protein
MRSRRVTSSYQRHEERIRAAQSAGLQSQAGVVGGVRSRRAVVLAVAARVEGVRAGLSQVVRENELAESSRAAAVGRAQQLLAQASGIDDSSAGLLLLPCAVAGAGGPQQGVSGDF